MSIWNALTEDGTLVYGQGNPPAPGDDWEFISYPPQDETPPPEGEVPPLVEPIVTTEKILGVWDYDGTPIGPPDVEAYTEIRPLGNEPDGRATPVLAYHYVMGHGPRVLGDPESDDIIERLYPTGSRPLAIEVRYKYFGGNANPAWDGWGWRAEIIGGAASRSPAARAIGIYSDAACTQYLYTTGAFTQQASEWQVDGEGDPLTVWATEYNPGLLGYNNDEPQDVHHTVLLGAVQEGFATLGAGQTSTYHEFWEHPQGYVPGPDAEYVDTGVTIAQLVAAGIYRTSGIATITLNQEIRLGETEAGETVFTGYWPTTGTPSDYIKITPHVSAAVGSKVWKWE